MSATTSGLAGLLRGLVPHALGDRTSGDGDYDRLLVIDGDGRSYDVVLRIDGGFRWRKHDTAVAELDRGARP